MPLVCNGVRYVFYKSPFPHLRICILSNIPSVVKGADLPSFSLLCFFNSAADPELFFADPVQDSVCSEFRIRVRIRIQPKTSKTTERGGGGNLILNFL
jgi:hypothetical protein